MFAAAADTIAALAHPTGTGAALLPPVTDLRTVSAAVAIAVASAADEHGLAEQPQTDPVRQTNQAMWRAPTIHHSNRSKSRSINATNRDLRLLAAARPFR
jgi:malic enzyme